MIIINSMMIIIWLARKSNFTTYDIQRLAEYWIQSNLPLKRWTAKFCKWNDKSTTVRFWKRQRKRKELQLLMQAWQRRRAWRFLEGNVGDGNVWVHSMLQVRYSIEIHRNISQRLGSCLSSSFLLWRHMQSWPLSSTTTMADFNFVFF